MNKWLGCIPLACVLAAGNVNAACSKDPAPAIPDGKASSQEDMSAAQQKVKAYVASGNAYLTCVQTSLDDPATPAEQKPALTQEYNAAVDEMQAVAANWKASITAFKSK